MQIMRDSNLIHCITILAECDAGEYGVNCQEDCSRYCADPDCDHRDGTCSPCDGWIVGEKCDIVLGRISFYQSAY